MERLPEPILQHIMSFMEYTDLIRSSAVSKAWKRAVSTVRCLNVTDDYIQPLKIYSYPNGDKYWRLVIPTEIWMQLREKVRSKLISAKRFIWNASKQNLHLEKCSFKSFRICHGRLQHMISLVDLTSLRELTFDVQINGERESWKCSLHESFFRDAHSLRKLVLGGLDFSFSHFEINLPALRELDLSRIIFETDLLEKLIKNCPELEILKIHNCVGFHSFKVLGPHHKLKRIDFIKDHIDERRHFVYDWEQVQTIEIKEAPHLEYFRCFSNGRDQLHTLDVAVAAYENLKVLDLDALCGTDIVLKSIELLVSRLNVLEKFRLYGFTWPYDAEMLKSIKISSKSLKKLWLVFVDCPVDVQVDAPHLSEFFYLGFISNMSLGTSSKKAVNFVMHEDDRTGDDKVMEFLRSFNHFEAVKLDDFCRCHFQALRHLGHDVDPPLWNVKHLIVGVYDSDRYLPINKGILEGLLWMAPQLKTLTFDDDYISITYQFVHENSRDVEEVPFLSQINRLVKVKVENCLGDAEGFQMKKYYFPLVDESDI